MAYKKRRGYKTRNYKSYRKRGKRKGPKKQYIQITRGGLRL